MEQKDIENLKSKEYITEIIDDDKTIYPLSLNGVKKLTENIAKSDEVDVEYLTVNKLEDVNINKFNQNSTKPKFIFCFLNKTTEETKREKEPKRKRMEESKEKENIPEHHFLPIILFNGKKYIFDLDLRKIEDSEFVKKIITQNINNSDFNNAIKDLESLHFIDNIKDDDKKIIDKINTFKTTLNSLSSTNIVNFIQEKLKNKQ